MNPLDLIQTAKKLAKGRGTKPRQADLRRSVSTAYYTTYHCIAKTYADNLIGTNSRKRNDLAYRQAYRSLLHAQIRHCCNRQETMKKFLQKIQYFGDIFAELQSIRESADYDPGIFFYRSQVLKDIKSAERAIISFNQVKINDRRAFLAFATTNFRKL